MRKKDKGFKANLALPIFIVFILVTSMFGYMWSGASTKLDYNGFKFLQLEDNSFLFNTGGSRIAFNYFPSEIEWINASPITAGLFATPMVYITSNPESEYLEIMAQIQFNFAQLLSDNLNIYAQTSFTSENEYGLPVVTCKNATLNVPVIHFEMSNSTNIDTDGACIKVMGKNRPEMFMAYERLLYIILGVME